MSIREQFVEYINLLKNDTRYNGDAKDVAFISDLVINYLKTSTACLTYSKEEPYDTDTQKAIDEIVETLISDNQDFYDKVITDEMCDYVDHMIELAGF